MGNSPYVATSMSRRLIARMQSTHERRRISVFSGPPGIGKTTAINILRRRDPKGIGVVKIARKDAKEVLTLKHVLEIVRHLSDSPFEYVPTSIWELRKAVFSAISEWAGIDPKLVRKIGFDFTDTPPLTIIFDEAQNLSRQAIESLRYWNDDDLCYSPFPIGLIFVGNSEFSLAPSLAGESVISAAVADRALYLQTFDYDELTDQDLRLVIQANGVTDQDAVESLVTAFRGPRSIRSLRRMVDLLDELRAMSDGAMVTAKAVREALELM